MLRDARDPPATPRVPVDNLSPRSRRHGSIDSMTTMPDSLRDLARAQGGVLLASQAATQGIDEHGLQRLAGHLHRVRRNAYALAPAWATATPEGRLALQTRAILLDRPGSVASHQSALALHGLPLHGVPMGVDVLAFVGRTRVRRSVRAHPFPAGVDAVDLHGFAAVPIPWAIAQVLARHGRNAGLVPLDRALHDGVITADEAEAALAAQPLGPRRRLRLGQFVRAADPKCESVGETLTRLLLVDLGYAVQTQVEFSDDRGMPWARVDFLVAGRVIVEFDGLAKYAGPEGRDALAAEKQREDRLRSLGYAVVRITWRDLDRPAWIADQIRSALVRTVARQPAA